MTDNIVAGSIVRVIPEEAITGRLRSAIGKDLIVERENDTRRSVIIRGMPGGWVSKKRLELRRPADEIKIGKYIISLERNGELLPAARPRQYSSDAQALKVAEHMAAKHGGKFVVFRAVGEYEMPTLKPTFRVL